MTLLRLLEARRSWPALRVGCMDQPHENAEIRWRSPLVRDGANRPRATAAEPHHFALPRQRCMERPDRRCALSPRQEAQLRVVDARHDDDVHGRRRARRGRLLTGLDHGFLSLLIGVSAAHSADHIGTSPVPLEGENTEEIDGHARRAVRHEAVSSRARARVLRPGPHDPGRSFLSL